MMIAMIRHFPDLHMMQWRRACGVLVFCGLLACLAAPQAAFATPSPFGVGLPETTVAPSGIFAGFFAWVAAQQTTFYIALTDAVKALKADGTATWWLMWLSFAYGVFHAAGPGHGKAVISS